jgi:hypothetical protein
MASFGEVVEDVESDDNGSSSSIFIESICFVWDEVDAGLGDFMTALSPR